MNILIIVPSLNNNRPCRLALFGQTLAKNNLVTFLTWRRTNPRRRSIFLTDQDLKVVEAQLGWKKLRQLFFLANANKIVIISGVNWRYFLLGIAFKLAGKKVTIDVGNDNVNQAKRRYKLNNFLGKFIEKITVCSPALQEKLGGEYLPPPLFSKRLLTTKIAEKRHKILCLLEGKDHHGFEEVFRAFNKLRVEFREIKLIVASMGESVPESCQRLFRYFKSANVFYIGRIESLKMLKEIIERADFFVFPAAPTKLERNWGPEILYWMMAAGKPLVAADIGSVNEIVSYGGLVINREWFFFEAAMKRLIQEDDFYSKFCRLARKRAQDLCGQERIKIWLNKITDRKLG